MISGISFAGIIFMLVISVLSPVVLFLVLKNKLLSGIKAYAIGMFEYLTFGYIIKAILFNLIGSTLGSLQGFTGLIAACFVGAALEELGKYYVLTKYFKENLTLGNAVTLGLGHAGGEALFVSGISSINYITAYFAVNNPDALNAMKPENIKSITEISKYLSEQNPLVFWLASVQILSLIVCQTALTALVYRAIISKQTSAIVIPIILHATVLAAFSLPAATVGVSVLTTLTLIIFAVISYFIIFNNIKNNA